MELFAAFTLGLFGSLHCVGMCGPLMLAAGGDGKAVAQYQTGRLLTYALLGALLGSLGLGARLLQLQAPLAIVSGAALLLIAFARLSPERWVAAWPGYGRLQLALRWRISGWLNRGGLAHFGLGCCNGLLPCGLVYLAVIGAANAGGIVAGALFMLAFGLGTLPLLLGLLLTGRRLVRLGNGFLLRYTPVVVALAGALLLWRGWHAALPVDFQRFQDLVFPPMCH
ncbi:hypothetical protein CLV84_0545 [Neolewinella xylanilytica]|uniref:Urease accessory protein UreH-like transmembrane domain-containing protein n=1 Tax=Neolewinella xylanilytica TaxID=1514080 RepID=A0A2S6I801_9BACT|nr:sulfite exporter TauE/SafE family protein [Neolewinella xylanilytica]PPK87599.1 hypothetical protein CLV84_0545 [Neolewinella xylanilytica]